MAGAVQLADAVLRGSMVLPAPRQRDVGHDLARLAFLIVLFGMFYGGVMGSFSATTLSRLLQVVYAAVKVPLLLLLTFMISLPSFFVLNTLMGLRRDFAQAVGALITTQAGLTIILAAMAPFTALWYASYADYNSAILFNGVMFAVASISAQVLLRRLYRPLIERDRRHRMLLRLWLIIYVFVGIQMGWVLRPFIGSPLMETRFFRDNAFTNAYVAVGNLMWEVLTRAWR
jgi:hypothetical protein